MKPNRSAYFFRAAVLALLAALETHAAGGPIKLVILFEALALMFSCLFLGEDL